MKLFIAVSTGLAIGVCSLGTSSTAIAATATDLQSDRSPSYQVSRTEVAENHGGDKHEHSSDDHKDHKDDDGHDHKDDDAPHHGEEGHKHKDGDEHEGHKDNHDDHSH